MGSRAALYIYIIDLTDGPNRASKQTGSQLSVLRGSNTCLHYKTFTDNHVAAHPLISPTVMTNALLMVSRWQAGCWYQRDMSDTHHYRHNREHCESAFSSNLRGSLLTSSLESPAVIRVRPSATAIVLPNHQAVQLNATNDTPNSVASLPVFPSYLPSTRCTQQI